MKLLVTGGAGFIGANFIRHILLKADPQIDLLVNLDKLTYAGNLSNISDIESKKNYKFIQGDIADRHLLDQILKENDIDAVVNFAAESHVDRSIDAPENFIQTNIVGTFRLLEASRKHWNNGKKNLRFLHVSTDEVFGSLTEKDPAFTEKTPYAPNSPYSATKAASDHLMRAYFHTYDMPIVTTNCSNNYGPYQFPEKLIPLMILNALDGKSLPIYGDGLNIRDWLYVEDHCTAIHLILQKGSLGETYNIGGNNQMTNLQVVDQICTILDKLSPRKDGSYTKLKTFVPDRPGHDRRYAMDSTKIMTTLGWKPQETFTTGLQKTIQWYLANRNWCNEITSGKYQRQRLGVL